MKNIYELKEKLQRYENIKTDKVKIKDKQRNKTCYNCSDRNHLSTSCPRKENGIKCFKCDQYAHVATNCSAKEA